MTDPSPFIGRMALIFRGDFKGTKGKVEGVIVARPGASVQALVRTDQGKILVVPWSCLDLIE